MPSTRGFRQERCLTPSSEEGEGLVTGGSVVGLAARGARDLVYHQDRLGELVGGDVLGGLGTHGRERVGFGSSKGGAGSSDDQGSKSDSLGVQRNWWTDADRANFEVLTTALAAQYSQFEPVPGYFIDGNFTLGENIGDVGGLSLAYRAYHMALGGEEAAVQDWMLKRDGTRRGVVEVRTDDS